MQWSKQRTRPFYDEDGGFSTVGMVLALLITLSLIFTSAQVYKIRSVSADVQNIADASAHVAENQVASFLVAAQVCDAVSYSLCLTSVSVAGIGAIALCVPGGEILGEKLIEIAHKIAQARQKFVEHVAKGLDRLQKLLPFFAAAEACGVAHANSDDGRQYIAFAILVPDEGEPLSLDADDGTTAAVQGLEDEQSKIEEAAQRAEVCAKEAVGHKEQAFLADCGASPDYCMEERARSLGGLSGKDNPHYSNADTWSFLTPLQRAKKYYPLRLQQDRPSNDSPDQQADSVLRKRIYRYAIDMLETGYVHETPEGGFAASFPCIPSTLAELRQTDLYDEKIYPITGDGEGKKTMHAWDGCPGAQGGVSYGNGSIRMLDEGGSMYGSCPYCRFAPHSLSSVAAASTSTNNGFEHYYRHVAEEAEAYQTAREEQYEAQRVAQGPLKESFERLAEAAKKGTSLRIHPDPPGRNGAIVLAADISSTPVSSFFPNDFVQSEGSIGPCVALSASVLGEDDPDEAGNVISSVLDGLLEDHTDVFSQGISLVLTIWSAALMAPVRGFDALETGVDTAMKYLPAKGDSGLSTWAFDTFDKAISSIGLEPLDLVSYKPMISNSYHVVSESDEKIGTVLLGAKTIANELPASAVDPLGAAIDVTASFSTQWIEASDETITIATIDIGEGGVSIPIEIPLPQAVKDRSAILIDEARIGLKRITGTDDEGRVWQ